jgi:hypothetical protein
MSVKDALKQVLGDMAALPPDALRAELDRHRDGPLATALREASEFVASFAVVPEGDAPAPGSSWQHTNGNRYTVLAISNGDSTRPDEYPVTVVYQGADGKLWSRPLSRWHASMHPVAHDAGIGAPASAAAPAVEGATNGEMLPPLPANLPASERELHEYAEAAIALRLQDYDNFIRALCCSLSVGGWNSEGIMPLATADAKIKAGLAMLVEPWRTEVLELRALRLGGAAASGLPPEAVSRIAFEWLTAMWEAVAQLENLQATPQARQQAARALRVRLEQDPRVPGMPPAATAGAS